MLRTAYARNSKDSIARARSPTSRRRSRGPVGNGESMENGEGTARGLGLVAAAAVAGLVGVKETTVYRWCKEGKLPCLKVGKHWRVRREALEDFLKSSERSGTLVGQLDSFLRVPDDVLAIAQNVDILRRLDAAFFQVGEARGGLCVKFYGGEKEPADEMRGRAEGGGPGG